MNSRGTRTWAPADASLQSADLQAFYERNGYLGPFRAFEPNELEQLGVLRLIKRLETDAGGVRRAAGLASIANGAGWTRNRHLDIPAIARLCQCENVVARLRAILGPNLLLWRSNIFSVSEASLGYAWHQDRFRVLLNPSTGPHCSVQINLTSSTKLNCVAAIPQSHTWDDDELRRRGYTLVPGSEVGAYGSPEWAIPNEETVDMFLEAGEFWVFHSRLFHASVRARTLSGPMARHPWTMQLARWRRRISGKLSGEGSVRYSLVFRVATPETTILPAAFAEVPARATAVLLSGSDTTGINRLGAWAG